MSTNSIEITTTNPASTESIVAAISLLCSPVFGALNVANALGGARSDTWILAREHELDRLIDEAVRRGADLSEVRAACCDVLVVDTPPFRGAVGYDPRPRCPLCCRRHFKPEMSCGDSARFRNHPPWYWTRATVQAAIVGTYQPQ